MIIGQEARRLALVSSIYAALTFVMAYPFSASPASLVLADAPDTHLYLWTLAWDAHAFLHQPILIFDANIYYPYPNTLAYSENLIGSAFFAAPIIWLTGDLVLAMNLVSLLTCVLCGTGAYFMARRWNLHPSAAFLCGVVFAFAPPRFFRMGQLHMTAVQWIPFTLGFLHSYFETRRRRDLLCALGCFSLQVLSSGHGAAFLAVSIVLMLIWRTAFGQPIAWRQWLRDCGAAGAYLIAPSVWLLLPYRAAQTEAGLRREYPADSMPGLAEYLASPSRVHLYLQQTFFGRTFSDEAVAYLFPGVLLLIVAFAAVTMWRPARPSLRADPIGFFLFTGVIALLMFSTWPVEAWSYVYWLPGFNFIRVPSRFIVMVLLSLAVLASVAFDRFTRSWSPGRRHAGAAILAAVFLTEYSSYPFDGVPYSMEVPAIDRWLSTLPQPLAVAEVPLRSPGDLGAHERNHTRAMLHSTVHWHKTVHGYSGIRRPLHEQLYSVLTTFPDPGSINALRDVGATHVVVHSDDYEPERWRVVEARLAGSTDLRLLHTEGAGRVYEITSRVSSATRPSP